MTENKGAIHELGDPRTTATGRYCIDYPDPSTGNRFSEIIYAQGWVIDSEGVAGVSVQVDDHAPQVALFSEREDVVAAYPGYPTGKEGFTLSIPARDFAPGSHTLHLSYTTERGTTYAMTDAAFTVTANVSYDLCRKLNGHIYYLYDHGYTRAQAQTFAENEGLTLARADTERTRAFLARMAQDGGMNRYYVAGTCILDAHTGAVSVGSDGGTDCGFILEAEEIAPSKTVAYLGSVYVLIDAPLDRTQASSIQNTMAAQLATTDEITAGLAEKLLTGSQEAAFRLQSGYLTQNGEVVKTKAPETAGLVLRYTKPSVPERSVTYQGSTYYAINQVMPWQAAKAMAELMGGRLAVIPDRQTQDQIHTVVENNAQFSYWVGGNDLGKEGEFRWLDGSLVSDTLRFHGSEPNNYRHNEDYLMIYRDYQSALNDNGTQDPKEMGAGFILEVRKEQEESESFVIGDRIYVCMAGAYPYQTAKQIADTWGAQLIPNEEAASYSLAVKLEDKDCNAYWLEDGRVLSVQSGTCFYPTDATDASVGLILSYPVPTKKAAEVEIGGKTYVAYEGALSYDAAAAFCEAIGASLAAWDTGEEEAQVTQLLLDSESDGFYFGMTCREDAFV